MDSVAKTGPAVDRARRSRAPAVQVQLGSGRTEPMVLAALHASAAVGLMLWALSWWPVLDAVGLPLAQPTALALVAGAAGLGLLSGGLAARGGLGRSAADLVWDGSRWLLDAQAVAAVRVAVDAGSWLLLAVSPLPTRPGDRQARRRTVWLAAARWRLPAGGWHLLRVALTSAREPVQAGATAASRSKAG